MMKCPWMPITVHKSERYSDFGRIPAKDITTFGDCLKEECPFYGETVKEHMQEDGYRMIEKPICRRTKDESRG